MKKVTRHVVISQKLGHTLPMTQSCGMLAEKALYEAAIHHLESGCVGQGPEEYIVAERLLAECNIPVCKRSEVGGASLGRHDCCLGFSLSGRR